MSLSPALVVVAALLVIAGAAKLRNPQLARAAWETARLPGGIAAVRLAGAVEIAVGAVCIVRPDRVGELGVAGLYLVFAFVVASQLRSGSELTSCGCLGAIDAPPAWAHVGFNLTAAAVGCAAAIAGSSGLLQLAAEHPVGGLVVLLGTAAATRLAVVVFTDLPGVLAVYRRPTR
jgi:hypothetical protein